jgi:hypothetical protein
MTFDDWNRQETERLEALASNYDPAIKGHVRRARSGGLWRFMAYDDYVAYCEAHDITPEALVA